MRFCLIPLIAFVSVARATEPNTLTQEEQAAGWKLLFDGKTTSGWHAIGKTEFPSKGWVVEGGTLKHLAKGGGGDILSNEDYDSFELTWEWKISKAGNSGVKYNLPDPTKNVGCEYQMLDNDNHPDGKIKGRLHQTAALYDLIEPSVDAKPVPIGEWNSSRLVVNGAKVEHWLNGTKVVSYEFGSDALKTLVANSKYKTVPGFGIKKAGPILLQDHGDEVNFRSIKIHALK